MNQKQSLVEIHLAVFLFGMSGLFAKIITLPSLTIVWGRVFFSSTFLFYILKYKKIEISIKSKKKMVAFVFLGVVLALHWFSFFESIQTSTVAVGLITFSTFPFFVTILEPIVFKESLHYKNLFLALLTIIGVVLIVPSFDLGNHITQGVLWGLLSGFTYAILSLGNRRYVQTNSSVLIAFYEQLIATIILLPYMLGNFRTLTVKNTLLLIVLGVVFTAVSHSLFIKGLKHVKAQSASIISTLEPLYGIILAWLILGEVIDVKTLSGGILILGAVIYKTVTDLKELDHAA